jgi:hypothetical protein
MCAHSQAASIKEKARILHPARDAAKRFIVEFSFFCDESYDPPKTKRLKGSPPLEPKCYVVGGFIGDQRTWEKVEGRWDRKNKRVGVPRYHAAHLNAATWEFDGWGKTRRLRYSKGMLRILKDQKKKLHGISCGLYVDDYRRIISADGQRKMGHPYLVCFKECIATIAQHMEYGGFAPEDTFSVVLDQNEHQIEAVDFFYKLKKSNFPYRHRLETCTPGLATKYIGLQAADFVAYETFRLMQSIRNEIAQIRHALNVMFNTTGFMGHLYGEDALKKIAPLVDAAKCKANGYVGIPQYEWEPIDITSI